MQVKGEAPVTLRAGDTFYEGPGDVHTVARNASQTAPAKFLVFFVKDKGAPILFPRNDQRLGTVGTQRARASAQTPQVWFVAEHVVDTPAVRVDAEP